MRSAKKQERKYRTVNTAAPHALKKRLLTLALSLAFLLTCLPAALAVDLNVDAGFYFKQSRGGTWTMPSGCCSSREISTAVLLCSPEGRVA
jgi:lipopolysaccharide/colanic/teichoic acid biosynthesis glycosyltransferase